MILNPRLRPRDFSPIKFNLVCLVVIEMALWSMQFTSTAKKRVALDFSYMVAQAKAGVELASDLTDACIEHSPHLGQNANSQHSVAVPSKVIDLRTNRTCLASVT
jgi:hypothetical protein